MLAELCEFAGFTPSRLATEAGLATSTILRTMNGSATTRLSAPTLSKLRARFPDFPGWPQDRLSDRRLPFRGAEPDRADTVQIAQYDVAFGMGGSYLHEDYVEPERLTFSRSWLRSFTSSPFDQIFFAQGIGDSMTPTIGSSDIVLIDTAQRTPRAAELIWAVEMHGLGMIKRLRPEREGAVLLVADNPAISAIPCADGEMNIVGRVVAVVKRL